MAGRRRLQAALAALAALFLGGCWLPQAFCAAFIPFQSFMIWGATVAARYGAPLLMLMFVENGRLPEVQPGEVPPGGLYCQSAPLRAGEPGEGLLKVYLADYRRLDQATLDRLAAEAADLGAVLVAAPAGDMEEQGRALRERGIEILNLTDDMGGTL